MKIGGSSCVCLCVCARIVSARMSACVTGGISFSSLSLRPRTKAVDIPECWLVSGCCCCRRLSLCAAEPHCVYLSEICRVNRLDVQSLCRSVSFPGIIPWSRIQEKSLFGKVWLMKWEFHSINAVYMNPCCVTMVTNAGERACCGAG